MSGWVWRGRCFENLYQRFPSPIEQVYHSGIGRTWKLSFDEDFRISGSCRFGDRKLRIVAEINYGAGGRLTCWKSRWA